MLEERCSSGVCMFIDMTAPGVGGTGPLAQ